MWVLRDERRIDRPEKKVDRLERKMDDGFAALRNEIVVARGEARDDFRTLLAILLPMFMAMILGFAGILLQHL
jgi:hypothetical protein